MKLLLYIAFIWAFQYSSAQSQHNHDRQTTKRTWGAVGGGISGTYSYNMTGLMASISHSINYHTFDIKYRFLEEDYNGGGWVSFEFVPKFPPDRAHTLNLQYGVGYNSKYFACNVSTGIGIIMGSREMRMNDEEIQQLEISLWPVIPTESDKYKYTSFQNLNFPIEIDAQVILGNRIGLELNGFVALNKEILTGGVMFGIIFGRLR